MTVPVAGITDAEFAQFQKLIYQVAGISMADSKKTLLTGRLGKRLRELGMDSYGEYYRYVTSGSEPLEQQSMVDLLTTNETYFFREQAHFDFLREHILPAHPPGQAFRVWSAASSTGEEAYTLCMVLADELGMHGNWSILGSDISSRVLEAARRGQYWLDRTRGLPEAYLKKYCLKGVRSQAGSLLVAPELRRHTLFRQINLNQPLPDVGRFHLIFLRNVMIYFDNDTKRKVVRQLVDCLHPGGYFIIGHSESLNGINNTLRSVQPTIYRKPMPS